MVAPKEMADEPTRRPNPDPTDATLELVRTSFNAMRETMFARFEAMDRANTIFHEDLTRVPTSLDKAISQLRELVEARLVELRSADDHSTDQRALLFAQINDARLQLRELMEHRINALTDIVNVFKVTVNERFQLGDVQTEKAARDVKSAVDAAFAAAKEAVGEQNKSNVLSITKSETAFTKQIDQLAESVKAIVRNTDDKIETIKSVSDGKIGDLKDRVANLETRLEGRLSSGEGQKKGSGDAVTWLSSAVTVVAVVAAVIVSVIALGHH